MRNTNKLITYITPELNELYTNIQQQGIYMILENQTIQEDSIAFVVYLYNNPQNLDKILIINNSGYEINIDTDSTSCLMYSPSFAPEGTKRTTLEKGIILTLLYFLNPQSGIGQWFAS